MSFTQFTNLDFNTLRAQIKDYLRSNSNFSDFDFEGSNFSVLIDTLAYNSYITAYNTNMAVNESFIDSATLRENVVSLARNIGYVPRSKKSAVATVNFNVDVSSISAQQVKLNAGLVALGAVQGGSYTFSIPEDITVTPTSNGIASFNNISIYEGNYLTKTFVVDSSQTNQRYILPNANIDTSSIRVEVSDSSGVLTYNAYTNIFDVNSESRLFLVQEVDDEKYQIMFGDNVLGKKPANGATITVTYIVTNGQDGNNAANFNFAGRLTYISGGVDVDITSGISLLTTTQSSENGDSIESIDNIKYLAPRVYASQYRAVTPNDYKSLIPFLYPNIDSVSAYGGEELDPPEFGKVYITVKPKNGEFLSAVSKDLIKNDLKKYTVAGIKQEFLDLMYLYVEFDSTVSYDSGFIADKSNLQTRILSAVETYAKSADINSFGGRLKYSKLLSQIDKVDTGITSNITTLVMRRNMIPAYNSIATYEVCYGNKFHADLEGFNVRSSAFKIDGVDGDVYLTDFPNSDQLTGVVKFFTIDNGVITYINNNAGTVDYVKGEVILFPVTIVSSTLSNRVEIEVTPESNDIVAKENLYIVLDTTGNSKLNLLEDVLVSGSNVSGTNYTPPSSFISNKKYTR
tara:strand:- start:696 stop:2582 length:1887 start_codon:yes stop_codon:yes gene_type:complete